MGKSYYMILILILAFPIGDAMAEPSVHIEPDIIAIIESDGNPLAHNVMEGAFGQHQIRQCVIDDYNNFGPGKFAPLVIRDMFDPFISSVVADWYLNTRIPAMLRAFKIRDTETTRLIAYNAGISYAGGARLIPASTRTYIEKYQTLAEVLS